MTMVFIHILEFFKNLSFVALITAKCQVDVIFSKKGLIGLQLNSS